MGLKIEKVKRIWGMNTLVLVLYTIQQTTVGWSERRGRVKGEIKLKKKKKRKRDFWQSIMVVVEVDDDRVERRGKRRRKRMIRSF